MKGQGYDVEVVDVKDYDPEDSLAQEVGGRGVGGVAFYG